MAGAMMMERATMAGMPTMGMPAPMGAVGTTPGNQGMLMVPRCTMTFEKVDGGMCITCRCDDKASATMLQNLCASMAGGMCGCCCVMNGMMVAMCNLTMGMCACENIADGVKMTCTSGDAACKAMIQACCDCMTAMAKAGCVCCMTMNGMPVCCCC